jgi:hypothetical protein
MIAKGRRREKRINGVKEGGKERKRNERDRERRERKIGGGGEERENNKRGPSLREFFSP